MKDKNPSRTARYIAFCRALETQAPPELCLFSDPFAVSLLSDSYRAFARMAHFPILGKLVYAILDLGWPYSRSFAVVRTRALDDRVRDAIQSGARQLVLLGAGFDSRGFRLDEARKLATDSVPLAGHLMTETEEDSQMGTGLNAVIESLERKMIADALKRTQWHRGETADLLQIPRRSLQRKMQKYNLRSPG